ncbi:hypothetical protein [Paenibacillus glycanilyticus]|uniref:Uncharacterized protein n=1 Tax=Paenibacillus glycanilyticus TaxID=126569 RepID=A0ABQ6GJ69_9BACL|nr:hypothetical protein [Paenibacillus glycanilyticus]GLX70283.1 hypothetical protein MU1_46290 [Paenibacillus glycanilyticus]
MDNGGLIGNAADKVKPYYYFGGIIGCITGYVIAKVYLIWAMLFITGGFEQFASNEWNPNSRPVWVLATEHPSAFTFWVTVLFSVIGVCMVKLRKYAAETEKAETKSI